MEDNNIISFLNNYSVDEIDGLLEYLMSPEYVTQHNFKDGLQEIVDFLQFV